MAGKEAKPFVVSVDEIPDAGMELAQDMPEEWISGLLGPQFFRKEGLPRVEVRILRAGPSVVAQGRVRASLGFICARCAEEMPFPLDHSFSHVFVRGHETGGLPDGVDEDPEALEFTFIEGATIDIEPLAAEEVVLALPQFPLCSESCKGVCQHCGRNLNEGACECHVDVVDPRWEKLRQIKL
jgi:uncharacterized protein